MKQLQKIARRLFESKATIHLIFSTSFVILFNLPVLLAGLPGSIIFRVLLYSLFLLLCIYSGRFCCKKWLMANRFQQFFVYSFIALLFLFLMGVTGMLMLSKNKILPVAITVFVFLILFFLLGIFLSITRTTILKQLREAEVFSEQKQSELKLLQNQLTPHFFFNTLNNLYGLSISHHERIPHLLLKLSDLLRYSVYRTNIPFVPLMEEVVYINNYIDFEIIRMSDRLILQKEIQAVDNPAIVIAPMVFIVFIENAFKHARNTLNQKIYVDISLKISGGFILFSVSNSYNGATNEKNMDKECLGLGITNVVKRLKLLYGKDYTLIQHTDKDSYKIDLTLKIKEV